MSAWGCLSRGVCVARLSLIVVRHAHTEGSSLDLAFSGRTEQRNYIEMGLSTPRVVKVMAKYYISIYLSVKTTMEFSTRHLACFTMQFRLVGTSSNQINLVVVHVTK